MVQCRCYVDQLLGRFLETTIDVVIRDSSDRPAEAHQLTIANLVPLRVEASTVPRDVVDLDSELEVRRGEVDPDLATRVEQHRYLRHEFQTATQQSSEQTQLEV